MEWINNKVLPYSAENYIQYPMINHNGKEYFKKECMYVYICVCVCVCVCITESLCCIPETNTEL